MRMALPLLSAGTALLASGRERCKAIMKARESTAATISNNSNTYPWLLTDTDPMAHLQCPLACLPRYLPA